MITIDGGTGTILHNGVKFNKESEKMMDQWRIANDNTKNHGDVIDYNWERSDTFFSQIGSGMTESSGVFTFPQTGIYFILAQASTNGANHSYGGYKMEISTDSGGNYATLAYSYGNHLAGSSYENTMVQAICDVTDAGTTRFRMKTVIAATLQFSGDTGSFRTGVTFIRLGDT